MNVYYQRLHLPTGQHTEVHWSSYDPHLSELAKLRLLNEWNRISTIGGPPQYMYWM